jgi:hypothetical protein
MSALGKVGQVVRPGSHGARHWRDIHGENLVCVRYRHDEARLTRHTTIEIIVSSSPWQPADLAPALLRVGFEETQLRATLKSRGAIWEPTLRRWRTTLRIARELQLENRLDTPPPPL